MSKVQGYVSVIVPVRLVGSHGISKPGFDSTTRGVLSTAITTPTPDHPTFVNHFFVKNIIVLGVSITLFEVSEPTDGWQVLTVAFTNEQTNKAVEQFLQRLSNALTASFAPNQRDPWYGNVIVEVDWSRMHLTRAVSPGVDGISLHDSLSLKVEQAHPLSAEALENLEDSGLTEIFVEGMRVNRPKAKYISWFVILEELERLATAPDFDHLFKALFPTKENRKMVARASNLTGKPLERLQAFLGNPNHTVETRAEKLCIILQNIGIEKILSLNSSRIIDVELCKELINGRNALAHKGTNVDEDLLYRVLFPLSFHVMIYLNNRER